ncbi:MAG: hypothetical protein Q9204_004537 [Flavoplaca sp. TL-2023a]
MPDVVYTSAVTCNNMLCSKLRIIEMDYDAGPKPKLKWMNMSQPSTGWVFQSLRLTSAGSTSYNKRPETNQKKIKETDTDAFGVQPIPFNLKNARLACPQHPRLGPWVHRLHLPNQIFPQHVSPSNPSSRPASPQIHNHQARQFRHPDPHRPKHANPAIPRPSRKTLPFTPRPSRPLPLLLPLLLLGKTQPPPCNLPRNESAPKQPSKHTISYPRTATPPAPPSATHSARENTIIASSGAKITVPNTESTKEYNVRVSPSGSI